MAKKKDNKDKVEKNEAKEFSAKEEGSLFEAEPEESTEIEPEKKKKSIKDIVKGENGEPVEDEKNESEEVDTAEEEDTSDDIETDAEPESEDEVEEEKGEETEEPEKVKEVLEEEKAEEEFQAGIPSEEKKVKKAKKKKGFLKTVLVFAIVMFVLLLGAFVGVQVYNGINKQKEPKADVKTEAPPQEATKPAEDKVVYVTAEDGLNLREEANAKGKLAATMPYGTKLTVLEEQGEWYKVDYNDQDGWCAKLYTSDKKPAVLWKTYTGTGFSPTAPKFSMQYPADWVLSGYTVTKTDSGKEYKIALGEGGHGIGEGDASITSANKDETYNGYKAIRTTVKKSGKITLIVVNFTKGNDYTNIEFTVPDGYDQSYIDTFDKMLETFKYL